ncbi:hypothetical protein SY2F82_13890 [Streptomyces sp. Y2F8-2]|uniref:hypothetical protein n=1 Tax=unclassified Streptomyces TaxID=2593676 RepID=UPI001905BF0E|nr:hypothetical protein [Streptomyces sp. Y2F8-2]GHJ99591.1 hypothetical protein SY2F82_13890 [Streptomyces sp. Y2F8-2]
MAVDQLPGAVREYASYLNGLLARLDQGGGWCGVFWQRDPDGMRACLEGREVPPWDVVEALLQDLAAAYGPAVAAPEAERARALHGASLAAYDARPGARKALGDRLDMMLREKRFAAERRAALTRRLGSAATREEAASLRIDLAWARDDHDRAAARCAELRRRMEALDHRALPAQGARSSGAARAGDVFRLGEASTEARASEETAGGGTAAPPGGHAESRPAEVARARGEGWPQAPDAPSERPRGGRPNPASGRPHGGSETPDTGPADDASVWRRVRGQDAPGPGSEGPVGPSREPVTRESGPAPAAAPAEQRSKRRPRGSARFAGMMDVQEPPTGAVPPVAAPAPGRRVPRGARFAGAAGAETPEAPQSRTQPLDEAGRQLTADTVAALVRLRAEGRSGEAHALLVEAAHWPADRYPLLAAELHRAGLGADWATLLWEAASLPADRLVAAADALTAAGRGTDGEEMLRQGVARPAKEIGEAVLGLHADGRHREVGALLDAYVRVRTPQEAARSVAAEPQLLVPLLLEAARGVSAERHWDLVHALRVAGFTA